MMDGTAAPKAALMSGGWKKKNKGTETHFGINKHTQHTRSHLPEGGLSAQIITV